MKAVSNPWQEKVSSLNGPDRVVTKQKFMIEESDREIQNWLGYRHRTMQVLRVDVGRVVMRMTDGSGWECHYWAAEGDHE